MQMICFLVCVEEQLSVMKSYSSYY
jgi:hypothetical protein